MKKITKYSFLLLLILLLNACKEEDLTGNATLVFAGNIENLEIDIYPETVFTVSELIRAQPLIRNLAADNGEVIVSNLNPGNYTWYNGGSNIGFFQITAGETRIFEFSIFAE
ncbi:MAG: hypothetical protein ABJH98_05275 [Reichenbachiella sp.]|uniref:hypothetical protein n=1 Tax=Reichenbachiella sp. TaxID=2184521 RepID=UPI003299F565